MKKAIAIIIGTILGFGLGLLLPYILVSYVVKLSGDSSVAGGMFLILATAPAGAFLGGTFGAHYISKKTRKKKTEPEGGLNS